MIGPVQDVVEPRKRGAEKKTLQQYRDEWTGLYDAIVQRILLARRDGDTLNVGQLATFLSNEFTWGGADVAWGYFFLFLFLTLEQH